MNGIDPSGSQRLERIEAMLASIMQALDRLAQLGQQRLDLLEEAGDERLTRIEEKLDALLEEEP